jgi:hypothetical protein
MTLVFVYIRLCVLSGSVDTVYGVLVPYRSTVVEGSAEKIRRTSTPVVHPTNTTGKT